MIPRIYTFFSSLGNALRAGLAEALRIPSPSAHATATAQSRLEQLLAGVGATPEQLDALPRLVACGVPAEAMDRIARHYARGLPIVLVNEMRAPNAEPTPGLTSVRMP